MARKTAIEGTLEQQRAQIKRRYKHGAKSRREMVPFESLSDVEQAVKKTKACFFKAADYSYTYIADALGTTRGTVKGWFENDPTMAQAVADIQLDFIEGAVKLLKTYAIELVEMLVEIARSDIDPKVRIQAITEALDRIGMAKVNKSESAVTKTQKTELDLVDKTGLMAAMKEASPEAQQQMAKHLDDAMALASEHLVGEGVK